MYFEQLYLCFAGNIGISLLADLRKSPQKVTFYPNNNFFKYKNIIVKIHLKIGSFLLNKLLFALGKIIFVNIVMILG